MSLSRFGANLRRASLPLMLFLVWPSVTETARAQTTPTAFTYQGQFTAGGVPADGTYSIEFRLFDTRDVGTGAQVGDVPAQPGDVKNGAFTVQLDFGAGAFPGAARFLEIIVNGTPLNPRQPVTATPYAIRSLAAATATNSTQLGGVDASRFVQTDAAGNVTLAGNLTVGGSFSPAAVNAATDYELGGQRVMSAAATNLAAGFGSGTVNSVFNNSYFGTGAGHPTTPGCCNSFFGFGAGKLANSSDNSFFGSGAGAGNMTGRGNTFVRAAAGGGNTTGYENSYFGVSAGASGATTTTPGDNSFFGYFSGNLTSGSGNSFFGAFTAANNTTGTGNTFAGYNSGRTNATGSDNTIIGTNADVAANNLTNATAVGANARVSQSNSLVLGSVSGVNGATADTNVGIGTTQPRAKLDVTGGNILVGTPGQGLILKSPNGSTCRLLSIDNAARWFFRPSPARDGNLRGHDSSRVLKGRVKVYAW